MILMSLGVSLTQMKVFSFKDALITSTGRVIIGPLIGFALISFFNLSGFAAGVLLIQSSMPKCYSLLFSCLYVFSKRNCR